MSTFFTFKLLNTTEFQIAFDYNFSAFTFRSRKFQKYINLHRKDTSKVSSKAKENFIKFLSILDKGKREYFQTMHQRCCQLAIETSTLGT